MCNARLAISGKLADSIMVQAVPASVPEGLTGADSEPQEAMPPTLQPLTSVALGGTVTVAEIKLPPESRPRLMEMGLLVGTPVELVRFAPLGDPVEIKVRGYHLTLRKHEAEQILVQPNVVGCRSRADNFQREHRILMPLRPAPPPAVPRPGPLRKSGPRIAAPYIVLTGNPNSGKTTLFNALTGLRAKVGNYAGVTVERKEGRLLGAPAGVERARAGSARHLQPQPAVARRADLARRAAQPAAGAARALRSIVVVVDASNLQRNLYYATPGDRTGVSDADCAEHGGCGGGERAPH